jgi:transposase
MPKAPLDAYGYECPYRAACPHLQGMSAEWMWLRHQEDIRRQQEDRQRIDELVCQLQERDGRCAQSEKENTELKARLHALHQKQFKGRVRGDGPESSQATQAKKKKGAPKGHPPWNRRPPDHVDRTVPVPAPQECPHCGCDQLGRWEQRCQHLQEDIVLCPRTWVVCFDHAQGWCPECRRPVMQAAPGELIGSYIGPVAKSTAVFLRKEIGISCRQTQQILSQLFGLPLVAASVVGFERAACAKGQALHEDLQQKVQASEYLHLDETWWRVDGVSWWLWYAGNEDLAFFHADAHRSRQAAQAVVGSNYQGLINTDDYAVYEGLSAGARQSCLAHPLRQAREALQTLGELEKTRKVDGANRAFLEAVKEFLQEACETGGHLREGKIGESELKGLKADYPKRLARLCGKELSWEVAERLRARLWKQRDHLFTFLDHPEVQPTNNQAEQSLRRSVIIRKVTFGSRSPAGAQRHALLTSLVMTAQRQGRDARAAFQELFTQPLAVAQRAFYRLPACARRVRKKRRQRRVRGPTGPDPHRRSFAVTFHKPATRERS